MYKIYSSYTKNTVNKNIRLKKYGVNFSQKIICNDTFYVMTSHKINVRTRTFSFIAKHCGLVWTNTTVSVILALTYTVLYI